MLRRREEKNDKYNGRIQLQSVKCKRRKEKEKYTKTSNQGRKSNLT